MILGKTETEIVKLASDYQNAMFDGVVQYNYETGKLFGASFSTGETENPKNPFIEVFRLHQGERGEFDYDCNECPFRDGFTDDKEKGLYPKTRELCCLEVYVDEYFRDDWEDNFRDGVEMQIRDVLSDHLGETISKLNEIRIALSDKYNAYAYFDVRTDDWESRVLDFYVDNAIENGFTTSVSPRDWLDAEIEEICMCSESVKELSEFVDTLRKGDFDGALELLHRSEFEWTDFEMG